MSDIPLGILGRLRLGLPILPLPERRAPARLSVTDASRGHMPGPSDMLAVSRTAQRLASGYYAFLVAHSVAVNPRSINSLPPAKSIGADPIGEIKRKGGT